jgi:hypothetical protein
MTLIKKIQSVLSPDLVKLDWKELTHPMAGHCYHASEALYHLWGKRNGYVPAHVEVYMGTTWGWVGHWFLVGYTGTIIDPTAEQFGKRRVHYDRGVRCGFLTKEPSKRAAEVMRRVAASVKL